MVAGDEVGGRLQPRQRCRRRAQVLHAAVHQVADDRHDVRLGGVDRVDDLLREIPAEDRAQVDVADHRDAVTVRRARELGQRHGDALHARAAQDAVRAIADRPHGGSGGGPRDDPGDEEATRGLRGGLRPGLGRPRALPHGPSRPRALRPVPGRLPGLRRLRGHAVRGHRLRLRCGRCGARPPRRQAAQHRPYYLTRHHAQQQVDRQREPQEARPGQDLLEPEGRARALGDDGSDSEQPAARDHRGTRSTGGARTPGGVAE